MMLSSADRADLCLGRVIRRRRLAAGISLEAIGETMGISYQQVQKYENGSNRVAFSRLLPLAAALNCSASELVTDVEREMVVYDQRKNGHSDPSGEAGR
ncbi:helix-turn-helix domain-containing protein [Aureimonas ureilytica]|uniref:helix-turn-helix domain-containing protein n=1 Tax=Aureimonas ureilytica TaxID=401562 RepID=UPI00037C9D69|nr:helix-turn-helix transcriptional regulator [Aureimonas ureilytica]